MRPPGPVRLAVVRALTAGPGDVYEIAARVGHTPQEVRRAVRNLSAARQVRTAGRVPSPFGRRGRSLYAGVDGCAPDLGVGAVVWDVWRGV